MMPLVMEVEASDMVEITMQVIGREIVVVTMIAMETLVALILEEITIKISPRDRMKVEPDTTFNHSRICNLRVLHFRLRTRNGESSRYYLHYKLT
jgi:hypothetical protein